MSKETLLLQGTVTKGKRQKGIVKVLPHKPLQRHRHSFRFFNVGFRACFELSLDEDMTAIYI